jgi:hypothetical protein
VLVSKDEPAVLRIISHVGGNTVEGIPHGNREATVAESGRDPLRAIWRSENRFVKRSADLSPVYIEGGHDLDVSRSVSTYITMHQARGEIAFLFPGVIVDALREGARTIPHPNNRYPNFPHGIL